MTLPPDSNLVWPPSSQRSQLAHQATSLGCGKWSLCWTVERGDLSIVISPFMCMCCSYPSYIVMWWLCVCTVYIYIYILIYEVCSVWLVTIQSHSQASQRVKGIWEWGYIATVGYSCSYFSLVPRISPAAHAMQFLSLAAKDWSWESLGIIHLYRAIIKYQVLIC